MYFHYIIHYIILADQVYNFGKISSDLIAKYIISLIKAQEQKRRFFEKLPNFYNCAFYTPILPPLEIEGHKSYNFLSPSHNIAT